MTETHKIDKLIGLCEELNEAKDVSNMSKLPRSWMLKPTFSVDEYSGTDIGYMGEEIASALSKLSVGQFSVVISEQEKSTDLMVSINQYLKLGSRGSAGQKTWQLLGFDTEGNFSGKLRLKEIFGEDNEIYMYNGLGSNEYKPYAKIKGSLPRPLEWDPKKYPTTIILADGKVSKVRYGKDKILKNFKDFVSDYNKLLKRVKIDDGQLYYRGLPKHIYHMDEPEYSFNPKDIEDFQKDFKEKMGKEYDGPWEVFIPKK